MVNSRAKGKRGELEAVKFLKSLGFTDARRTQQYNGVGLSDVVCPETLPDLHIEIKYGEVVKFGNQAWCEACELATEQAGSMWVLLFRNTRGKWFMTLVLKGMPVTIPEQYIRRALEGIPQ